MTLAVKILENSQKEKGLRKFFKNQKPKSQKLQKSISLSHLYSWKVPYSIVLLLLISPLELVSPNSLPALQQEQGRAK